MSRIFSRLAESLEKIAEDMDSEDKMSEEEIEKLPSIQQVKSIRSELAQAAQTVYDDWELDEHGEHWEVGTGGICHLIVDKMLDVLHRHNIDTAQSVSSSHEVHVYIIAAVKEGVFHIDIPYNIYETGGGYHWKKIEGVKFEPDDITISRLDSDPSELHKYGDI